jgi:hypothetical protein
MSLEDLRALVTDHRACDQQEVATIRDYHARNSHVACTVVPLIDSGAPVQKAKVKGCARIGSLKTFSGNLGDAYCRALFGMDRYRVAQVLEVFRNPNYNIHPDIADMRQKVNQYKWKFAPPTSDPKVTIVSSQDNVLIADGNKTAIAAFVYALEIADPAFQLSVCYIDVPHLVIHEWA